MAMLTWFVAGAAASLGIAWLAATCHVAGLAPVGLISIAVGFALAASLAALAATLRIASVRALVFGTIILSLLTVLAEHAWLYRDFRRQWHDARAGSPEAAMFRAESPWSPREYFTRDLTPQRAAIWCLDACLITAAAVGTMVVLHRYRSSFCFPPDVKQHRSPNSDP